MSSTRSGERAPVEVVRVDVDGRRLFSNTAHARAMNLTREQLRGVDLSQPANSDREEEIDVLSRALARVRDSGDEVTVSFRRTSRDGAREYEVRCTPELDEDDAIEAIIIFVSEIVEAGSVRTQLSETWSLIEGIANGTSGMIAAEDREFRFLYFNDAYRREFKRLWGSEPEIGMSMIEAMAPWPSEQEKARSMWARALEGESFAITDDFGPSEADRQVYELHFNPIHHANGEQIGAAHILRNVTDEVQIRDALVRAREDVAAERDRLRAVLEILPVSVFIADAAGRIVLTNKTVSSIWGRAAHTESPETYDQDYKAWWTATGERVRSHEWAIARALKDGETSIAEEIEIETAHSDRRYILNYALPILDESDRISGAVALNVDVTDMKQAEAELQRAKNEAERANTAKTEFLAHMSHEIRTPVSGIIGMVDVLLSRTDDPQTHEHLGLVKEAADSLLAVIGDILDLSRIESGTEKIEAVPWSVRESLRTAVTLFEQEAVRKGLSFSLEIDDTVPELLLADGPKIGQIVRNLVSNAVKYTSEGSVLVRVESDLVPADVQGGSRAQLRIGVSDTGRGIPPERQEAIFESFVRVRRSVRDADVPGTGLGLTITRRLTSLLGGRLSLNSTPGVGSTFTAVFELEPVHEQPPQASEPAGSEGLPSLNVLLAEDNAINRMLVKMTLEDDGHHVTAARTGVEAVDLVRAANRVPPFDVILMDVQMPEMDGLEAVGAIRAMDGEAASVPVIALTAFAMAEDEARVRAAGMDGYVTKPIDFEVLSEEMRRVLVDR